MFRSRPFRVLLAVLAVLLVAAAAAPATTGRRRRRREHDHRGRRRQSAASTPQLPDRHQHGRRGRRHHHPGVVVPAVGPDRGVLGDLEGLQGLLPDGERSGGVDIGGKKYKIEVKDKDDEYNASKTVQNINDLVGVDGTGAFAVFNVVGTANNIAIREKLGALCVPQVFAATGRPAWGNPKYPWPIGSTLAPYSLEGQAFAEYLKDNKPDATVAMLVQSDEFGQDYEQGFKKAIEGTDIKVVKVEKYAPGSSDVNSQVTSLAATKADAFFDGATLLACPNALQQQKAANWKPSPGCRAPASRRR